MESKPYLRSPILAALRPGHRTQEHLSLVHVNGRTMALNSAARLNVCIHMLAFDLECHTVAQ